MTLCDKVSTGLNLRCRFLVKRDALCIMGLIVHGGRGRVSTLIWSMYFRDWPRYGSLLWLANVFSAGLVYIYDTWLRTDFLESTLKRVNEQITEKSLVILNYKPPAGITQLPTLFGRTQAQAYTVHSQVSLLPRSSDIKWPHTDGTLPVWVYIWAGECWWSAPVHSTLLYNQCLSRKMCLKAEEF